MTLIRNLVTGSFGTELDIILSQGKQPDGTIETSEIKLARRRCRVEQLALTDDLFKGCEVSIVLVFNVKRVILDSNPLNSQSDFSWNYPFE